MAEIKSTIELALERTKHLVMTEKEKRELAVHEHLEKITGYAQKYLDGIMTDEEIYEALEAIPEEIQEEAKKKLMTSLLEKSDIELAERLIIVLKNLVSHREFQHVDALEATVKQYSSRFEETKQNIFKTTLEELERRGIEGSSVRIIPEKSRSYRALMDEYRLAFNKAKEKLAKALGI